MSLYLGSKLLSGVATDTISNAHSLLDFKWSDHILNEMSWLRADTFSWHNGLLYKGAYNHLESDILNYQSTGTDIIEGIEIWYTVAPDGHKIVDAGYQDQTHRTVAVEQLYNKTGVAWYYIIDRVNQRFKLPRTKYGFVGVRDIVGKYVSESLPNINATFATPYIRDTSPSLYFSGCVSQGNEVGGNVNAGSGKNFRSVFNASVSSSAYQDNAPVQERATQMYLYFYVGEYSQSQAEQVATLDVEMFNNKADTNMLNLTDTGKNIANWSNNVTNCITEIPQDIKLELNNGTLTLKAGSKVYVPNGSGVFDTLHISTDISYPLNHSTTNQRFVFVAKNNLVLQGYGYSVIYSGTTQPTLSGTTAVWYDTTNNIIKYTNDSGNTWTSGLSLPICFGGYTNGTGFTSIDQVFNGFGYIGSTVFVLPGVKGLAPNGRNEDGTLKNKVITETNVHTFTMVGSNEDVYSTFYLDENGIFAEWWRHDDIISESLPSSEYNHVYIPSKNEFWACQTGDYWQCFDAKLFTVHRINGVVQSIKPTQTFRALSWNDKEDISSWSMPSGKWLDISTVIPIDGVAHTYTAPTNGYIFVSKRCANNNEYLGAYDDTFYTHYEVWGTTTQQINFFVPLKRGQSIIIRGTASGADFIARFMYAEGEI